MNNLNGSIYNAVNTISIYDANETVERIAPCFGPGWNRHEVPVFDVGNSTRVDLSTFNAYSLSSSGKHAAGSEPCRAAPTTHGDTPLSYNHYNTHQDIIPTKMADGHLPVWTLSNKFSGRLEGPLESIFAGCHFGLGGEEVWPKLHSAPNMDQSSWRELQGPLFEDFEPFECHSVADWGYTPRSQLVSNSLDMEYLSEWRDDISPLSSGTEDSGSSISSDSSGSTRGMLPNGEIAPPSSSPPFQNSGNLYQQHFFSFATADWVTKNGPEPTDSHGRSLLMSLLSVSDSHGHNDRRNSRDHHRRRNKWERRVGQEGEVIQKKQSTYVCQVRDCGKRLERKDRALSHVRMHLGYRPFVCNGACGVNGCTEAFASRSYLKSHKQRPKEDCEVCGRSFFKKEMIKHTLHCHYNTATALLAT